MKIKARSKFVLFPKTTIELNTFCIIKVICEDKKQYNELAVDENGKELYGNEFIVKGTGIQLYEGIIYDFEGEWVNDNYGRSFLVKNYTMSHSQTEISIVSFLQHRGKISPLLSQKIVNKFGKKTFEIITNHPERLQEIPRIKDKQIEDIVSACKNQLLERETYMLLSNFGVDSKSISYIMNHYQQIEKCDSLSSNFADDIKKDLYSNPYKICAVNGFSYKMADAIALNLKVNRNVYERYKYGLLEILNQNEFGGNLFAFKTNSNTCMLYENFLEKAIQFFGLCSVPNALGFLNAIIKKMIKEKEIIVCKNPFNNEVYIYKYNTYSIEKDIAQKLAKIIKATNVDVSMTEFIEQEILLLEKQLEITLAPEQKEAVINSLLNNIAIITGGPGTGKSTIINFIVKIYRKLAKKYNLGERIFLTAPTGRAAKKMEEVTKFQSHTLHRLLNLTIDEEANNEATEFLRREPRNLESGLVICDEFSMCDQDLFLSLLDGVNSVEDHLILGNSKLILIGDIDQLPSIGVGNVLQDLIDTNVIPIVRLTTIFRQGNGNLIPLNSKLIREGKTNLDYDTNFQFIKANTYIESLDTIQNLYIKEVEMYGLENVMVLSPTKKLKKDQSNLTCVDNLNTVLHKLMSRRIKNQATLNKKKSFQISDKVMHINRNTDKLSNGDIGYVVDVDTDSKKIKIDFGSGNVVEFKEKEFNYLEYAYAQSIHKSQGSEYTVIILNLLNQHNIMLKRNLIYTAITRSKRKVYIVGQEEALTTSILRSMTAEDRRCTLLKDRILYFLQKNK